MKSRENSISKGFKWTFLGQTTVQISSVIFGLITARLLDPSDYGLIAMAVVFIGFADIIKDLGLIPALIQAKELKKSDLSTAFWFMLSVSALLGICLYTGASLISQFYSEVELEKVVKIWSINFLIAGLHSCHYIILNRALEFKKLAIIRGSSEIVSNIFMIWLAYEGFSYKALIYPTILKNIMILVLLNASTKWFPDFRISLGIVKNTLNFTLYSSLNSLMLHASRNIDNVIIGKLIGPASLGIYSKSYNIMLMPNRNIASALKSVLFPAMSSLLNLSKPIGYVYLKAVKFTCLIVFPLMFIIMIIPDWFTIVLLGERWLQVADILPSMCFLACINIVMTFNGTVFYAFGQPKKDTKLMLISTPILLGLFYVLGTRYGIQGIVLALIITELILLPYKLILVLDLIDVSLVIFLKNLVWISLSACVSGFAVYAFRYFCPLIWPLYGVLCSFTLGFLVYLIVLSTTELKFIREVLARSISRF